jgi:hypothetical protein
VSDASLFSSWLERAPYLLLQFLFGGLFSALFILYFQSSSHLAAMLWSLGLGGLLVANEFIDGKYSRFTLTWALFGLCAMLLFNFLLPFMPESAPVLARLGVFRQGASRCLGSHIPSPRLTLPTTNRNGQKDPPPMLFLLLIQASPPTKCFFIGGMRAPGAPPPPPSASASGLHSMPPISSANISSANASGAQLDHVPSGRVRFNCT